MKTIAHPTQPPPVAVHEPAYKNPLNLALTPDGRQLWVACEASGSVIVVDTATCLKVAELTVDRQPNDVCFTPDGTHAFVSNRLDDSVSVVDVAARTAIATIAVGDEPHGVLVDRQGRNLYVLNTSIDSISVIDVATLKEIKRLTASRSPWSLAESPDGQTIFVTHALYRKMNYQRVAIIRASNRYGRFGVREIRDGSRRIGRPLVIEMAYRVGDTDFTMQLERIKETKPDAIIHWGNASRTSAIAGARIPIPTPPMPMTE